MRKLLVFLGIFCAFAPEARAQDQLHYIPPVYSRSTSSSNALPASFELVLTTNRRTIAQGGEGAFDVSCTTGDGVDLPGSPFTVAADAPAVITLGSHPANSYPGFESGSAKLNTVLASSGIRCAGPDTFFTNIRLISEDGAQGASLTGKGRLALGTDFRTGHFKAGGNTDSNNLKSHFISVMATEDNTTVNFTEIKSGVVFQGTTTSGAPATTDPVSVVLQAGESYILGYHFPGGSSGTDDVNGTRVTASKPVAVNTGSWLGGSKTNDGGRDIAIDQTVPVDRIGGEYVMFRGTNPTGGNAGQEVNLERPLVVATQPNTNIFVNDSLVPSNGSPLGPGDYHFLTLAEFDGNGIMFVQLRDANTGLPTTGYLYQSTNASVHGNGPTMGILPATPCLSAHRVEIEDFAYWGSGEVQIVAESGAAVTVTDSNGSVTLPAPVTPTGTAGWDTYTLSSLAAGGVAIDSDLPFFATQASRSGHRGIQATYTGFANAPLIINPVAESSSVISYPVLLTTEQVVGVVPGGFTWYKDGEIIPGENGDTYLATEPGEYTVTGTTFGCGTTPHSVSVLLPGELDVQKEVVSISQIGDTSFDVSYRISVENFTAATLNSVQLADDLEAAFAPLPTTAWSLQSGPTVGGDFAGGDENALFDGLTAGVIDLLVPGVALASRGRGTIDFVVRVDIAGGVPAGDNTVLAQEGSATFFAQDSAGFPGTNPLNVVVTLGPSSLVGPDLYDLVYTVSVENTSNTLASSVSLDADLEAALSPMPTTAWSLSSAPVAGGDFLAGEEADLFDGLTAGQRLLLDPGVDLAPGEVGTVTFTVRLDIAGGLPTEALSVVGSADGFLDDLSDHNFGPGHLTIDGVEDADSDPTNDPSPAQFDTDQDGTPDLTDPDDDNDGVPDAVDPAPSDPDLCGDSDADTCDDCAVGSDDFGTSSDQLPDNDGLDTDSDGACDAGDSDNDNDGVPDGVDPAPLDPDLCGDSDADTCDDCAVGSDDFGTSSDRLPDNDGLDTDSDGACDAGDPDNDNDGVPDGSDPAPENPDACGDSDADMCDDCAVGVDDFGTQPDNTPLNDGPDSDGDGICDVSDDTDGDGVLDTVDIDDDNDGIPDAVEGNRDTDGDGVIDSSDLDADNDGILDVVEAGDHGTDGNEDGTFDCLSGVGANGLCDDLETAPDSGVLDTNADGSGPDDVRDQDGDGLPDFQDVDADGDGLTDRLESRAACDATVVPSGRCAGGDDDGDGIVNDLDTVVGFGTGTATEPWDSDGDGTADHLSLDADGDTLLDHAEGEPGCPDVSPEDGRCDGSDGDGDGLTDDVSSFDAPDADGDLHPDFQDVDSDQDGLLDGVEGQGDPDGDGIANYLDRDSDADGVPDSVEGGSGCLDASPLDGVCDGVDADENGRDDDAVRDDALDTDGDGVPDFLDLDSDQDGALDRTEATTACADVSPEDGVCDGPNDARGIPVDAILGPEPDSDGDGVPDRLDLDSDNDGRPDLDEVGSGCPDLNLDAVCDLPDSDGDGIVDSIDDLMGHGDTMPTVPAQSDGDSTPDFLDLDSDGDGMFDVETSDCEDLSPVDNRCDGPDSDGDGGVDAIDELDGFGLSRDTDGDGVADSIDLDDDNDGLPDVIESSEDTDGDGVPDALDLDSDNDGILDVEEAGHAAVGTMATVLCPGGFGQNGLCDSLETGPDSGELGYPIANTDGRGPADFRDLDADDDSLPDVAESGRTCTDDPRNNVCDLGDIDGDGIADSLDTTDGFGGPLPGNLSDTDGDGAFDWRDVDSDGDGIYDVDENQPGNDGDRDGRVDAQADADGDGVVDVVDDSDLDGTADAEDGDPGAFGTGGAPRDTDEDGTPDARDGDSDGDGLLDAEEAGDDDPRTPPVDSDGDGAADFQDVDADGDEIPDTIDNCPFNPNQGQQDTDGDAAGDSCDFDADGNGIEDDLGLAGGGCQSSGGSGTWLFAALFASFFLRRRSLLVLLSLLFLSAPAMGQGLVPGDYSVERFRLATDRDGILDVEWAEVPGQFAWDVGLWLGYADDPLTLYRGSGADRERVASLVSSRLAGNLVASVGVFSRLQLGVAVPIVFSQSQDVGDLMAGGPGSLDSFGVGDIRLIPKIALLRQEQIGVDVAVNVGLTLPTASSEHYFGEAGIVYAPELLLSREMGRVRIASNIGYRARKETMALNLEVDDEVFGHLGVGVRATEKLELDLTFAFATASNDMFGTFNRNYSEIKPGIVYDVAGPLVVFAAGGIGLSEGFATPDWRGVLGVRFSKRRERQPEPPPKVEAPRDLDGDGLIAKDQCPRDPEDKDGFEDGDGCSDPDNDEDGVLDTDDDCPLVPGVVAFAGCPVPDRDEDGIPDASDNCPDEPGVKEHHGCAEKQLVTITEDRLEILDIVYFRTNKAVILPRSFPLLDNVADVLNGHPEILEITVEGHTDSRGSDRYNKSLSQRRADAVRRYLEGKGVAEERLQSVGHGEEYPIDTNTTKEGRAANRRVEFKIGKREGIELKRSKPTETID